VIGWFEKDEATFLNLEGPLSDVGNPMQKKHVFRGPTAYVNILTENSVEAVTLANNHAMDYGQTGYDSTVATLQQAGVPFVERDSSCVFTTENGLTIGLYGAVYYVLDEAEINSGIAALREQGCDLVIFAPHWGVEGTYRPTDAQVKLGHAAIDAGADIVVGHHPHVLQDMESYNGGLIFYSLGNFSFGGNDHPKDYDSAVIRQEILREYDGTVRVGETSVIPISISSVSDRNNYQPIAYPDDSDGYRRVMEKLEGTSDFSDKVLEKYTDPDSDQYHAMLEEIRKELNFTSLHYHRLDDMIETIDLEPCKLCTYCWSGKE
jgi:poly-gamma-glutamate synthesis protein (capsule biosynthesis protein)